VLAWHLYRSGNFKHAAYTVTSGQRFLSSHQHSANLNASFGDRKKPTNRCLLQMPD
jgi:hypothetical protein